MRMLVRLCLIVLIPLAIGWVVLDWYAQSRRYVSSDNAYVKTNLIAVSSSLDGRVTSVQVADEQAVKAGQVLFTLDPRPHEIALAGAQAHMGAVTNEIHGMQAEYAQVQVELRDAADRIRFLQRRVERQRQLAKSGVTTASALDDVEYEVIEASTRRRALQQRALRALAALGGRADRDPEEHPKYLEAMAAREEAALALSYTRVTAPAAGTVSRVKLQIGEWLQSGRTVFTLIEDGKKWVEANLKESQLTHITVGQRVEMTVDAYRDLRWAGHVQHISGATGSEFLVLPAQNATGNWVKVVQRLPVKIAIDTSATAMPALRAGMTVSVAIDTEQDTDLWALWRQTAASLGMDRFVPAPAPR